MLFTIAWLYVVSGGNTECARNHSVIVILPAHRLVERIALNVFELRQNYYISLCTAAPKQVTQPSCLRSQTFYQKEIHTSQRKLYSNIKLFYVCLNSLMNDRIKQMNIFKRVQETKPKNIPLIA